LDTGFALGAAIAALLFVPALTGALGWLENRRSGESARQRELLGGNVACGLARAFGDSVWTLWLTMLALPFGRVAARRSAAPRSAPSPTTAQHNAPPLVVLVHGLYHNPAAWFVLRRRLARAGFAQVRTYAYASFGQEFADIAAGLADLLLEAGREAPGGRVVLVGHSLGGLVIRAACADSRLASPAACTLAGVVTLGTPHRGSTLAGMFGIGRLARGLAPGGRIIAQVRALPPCPCPALSLYSPTDGMVLPLSGALLDERERQGGWSEKVLPPTSHVGLLYSGAAARETLAFLRKACAQRG